MPSPFHRPAHWPLAALTIAVAALSACAGGPSGTALPSPVKAPTSWSADAGEAPVSPPSPSPPSPLGAWWSRFHDPVLSQLVTQALAANTQVLGAQASLREARALRDVVADGMEPSLGASASAGRSRVGRTPASNLYQSGLDASWEIDVFGGRRHALEASEATARASEMSLGDVQVSVAAEVALAYIAWRGTGSRMLIANQNLDSQQETLQLTLWREQAGLVTTLDSAQARTSTEQLRALLPSLQASLAQSRHALSVLTAQAPETLVLVLPAGPAMPQADAELTIAIPADTLRQRPDVRAAEAQVEAAIALVAQAESARWPVFALSGSLGLSALTMGTLGQAGSIVSSVLASASLPLFDGGSSRAQVRAQIAAQDLMQSSWQATVLLALQEVEDALAALRGDRDRLRHLQAAAEAATLAALLATQQYGSGLIDFQTVLTTQRTQLSAQDAVALTQTDLGSDHVRLYKALGGGWQPDQSDTTSARAEGGAAR
jgi:multidrug efflux system outer membrane protein